MFLILTVFEIKIFDIDNTAQSLLKYGFLRPLFFRRLTEKIRENTGNIGQE